MVAAVTESRSSACGQLFAEDFPTDLQRLGAELLHFLQTKSGALALAALSKRGLNPNARPFVPFVPAAAVADAHREPPEPTEAILPVPDEDPVPHADVRGQGWGLARYRARTSRRRRNRRRNRATARERRADELQDLGKLVRTFTAGDKAQGPAPDAEPCNRRPRKALKSWSTSSTTDANQREQVQCVLVARAQFQADRRRQRKERREEARLAAWWNAHVDATQAVREAALAERRVLAERRALLERHALPADLHDEILLAVRAAAEHLPPNMDPDHGIHSSGPHELCHLPVLCGPHRLRGPSMGGCLPGKRNWGVMERGRMCVGAIISLHSCISHLARRFGAARGGAFLRALLLISCLQGASAQGMGSRSTSTLHIVLATAACVGLAGWWLVRRNQLHAAPRLPAELHEFIKDAEDTLENDDGKLISSFKRIDGENRKILFRKFFAIYLRVVPRAVDDAATRNKADGQMKSLLTKHWRIRSEAGSAAQSRSGQGRKVGDKSAMDAGEQKKKRAKVTCFDPNCPTQVEFENMYCNEHALKANKWRIDQSTGQMYDALNRLLGKAQYDRVHKTWVSARMNRIPRELGAEERVALSQKIEANKISPRCIHCASHGRELEPNSVRGSPHLFRCYECVVEECNVVTSQKKESGVWRFFCEYYDEGFGETVKVEFPNKNYGFPAELYARSDATNLEIAMVCAHIDRLTQSLRDHRHAQFEERKAAMDAALASSRGYQDALADTTSVDPIAFLLKDPTLPGDRDADVVRGRVRAGILMAWVHVSPVDPFGEFFQRDANNNPALLPLVALRPEKIAGIPHLAGLPWFKRKDQKIWATCSFVRAFYFFGRKHEQFYQMVEGYVGFAHFFYHDHTRSKEFKQTKSSGGGIGRGCDLLAGCICDERRGLSALADLIVEFRVTKDATPQTCEFTVVWMDGGPVRIPITSDELSADSSGIYREGAKKKARTEVDLTGDSDDEVVDLTSP